MPPNHPHYDDTGPSFYKPHPWHGIPIGDRAPRVVTAFIEIVPTDAVKYEIDKATGYLKVDRPQKYSNVCPSLYGLIPRTLCAEEVAGFCEEKTGRRGITGDGDPMDICVLTEKHLSHGNILVQAVPVGGLRMLDGNEADDKIVAVLQEDAAYGGFRDIADCPRELVDRLRHYFLTYKEPPGGTPPRTEVTHVYGVEEAYEVIERSRRDYARHFPALGGAG